MAAVAIRASEFDICRFDMSSAGAVDEMVVRMWCSLGGCESRSARLGGYCDVHSNID